MKYFPKAVLLSLALVLSSQCCRSVAVSAYQQPTSVSSDLSRPANRGRSLRSFPWSYSPGEKLLVTVAIASADMSDDELNSEIAGVDWFDAGRFAEATFRSKSIDR